MSHRLSSPLQIFEIISVSSDTACTTFANVLTVGFPPADGLRGAGGGGRAGLDGSDRA